MISAEATSSTQSQFSECNRPLSLASDRLLSIEDLMRATGLCRTSIYAAIKRSELPHPIKINRAARWLPRDLQKFVFDRAAERARDIATTSQG